MRRGDLVTVAMSGDYGKPRPALVIQSDLLPQTDSVLVCPLTTTLRDAPLYRLPLPTADTTGLREPSQVMVDKIMAVRRTRCSGPIGRAGDAAMLSLGRLLALMVGLADRKNQTPLAAVQQRPVGFIPCWFSPFGAWCWRCWSA